ncbi:MAG: hypothetical protein JXA81_07160 [Sedimentisphaerales bacterium]|nr:hypothetical protein [Sedimentisphaerales bacterium]
MNRKFKNTLINIKGKYLIIAALITCFALPLCAARQSQISQFGITWTFDKDYTVGQFANGDYWVVGPVTIVRIHPVSVELNGRTMNGSMINPSPRNGQRQGYDSAAYGRYARPGDFDPSLNVARPNNEQLSTSNPLVLQPNSSLVSTESTLLVNDSTQLKAAAVLTVLDAPAKEGSFRPPYSGTDKTVRFNKEQLGYSLLASLKPVPGTPSVGEVERYFERPWIDHIPLWPATALHPVDNMPPYGREISTQIGVGALMLHLNFSNTQKEKLLVRYVQLGIDLYGIVQDGGEKNWTGMGGHASGRKWPILFAGLVLNDPNMKNIGRTDITDYGPAHPEYVHFGEDDQTFYVTEADIEVTHSSLWSPDRRDAQKIPYEQEDIGLPEWGIVHADGPERSNKFWITAYRQVSSPGWGGFVLAAHIMKAKELWNHDALFDYKDRYMQIETQWRQTSKFVLSMWSAYRKDYGPVWTMSPKLNITATGGTVTKTPNKPDYAIGDRVSIKAIPDSGYEFICWSGGLSEKANPAVIIMHSNQSITANFVAGPSANNSICDKTVCSK